MANLPILSARARIAVGLVSVGLVLGGSYQLVFVDYPARALQSAKDHYVEQLAANLAQANDLSVQNAERMWYEESYTAAVAEKVAVCETSLEALPATAEFSDMSVPEAITRVAALEAASTNAMQACNAAEAMMVAQDAARTRAANEYTKLDAVLKEVSSSVDDATNEFNAKSGGWLPKYKTPLVDDLLQAATHVTAAQKALAAVAKKLPADSIVKRGAPDEALAAFAAIATDVAVARDLGDKVTSRIAFILRAEREAVQLSATVSDNLVSLAATLAQVRSETGYTTAIEPFQSMLTTLGGERVLVAAALDSNDKVQSYELSRALLDKEEALKRDLDTFLETFHENLEHIEQAALSQSQVAGYAAEVTRMTRSLRAYHATSEWRDVAEAASTLDTLLSTHRGLLVAAVAHNGFREQSPAKAAFNLAQAEALIEDVESIYQKFRERFEALEESRGTWLSAENVADRAIESERPQIDQYGSYDSDAEAVFDTAVTYYNKGVNAANAKQYSVAIDYFNRAAQAVRGVGDDAEASYEAEQRRKKREAEAAAEEAAEAAARAFRALSDSDSEPSSSPSIWTSPSSNDSPFGGSDWDSSSIGSGDSGDWGGGYTSSDGGDW